MLSGWKASESRSVCVLDYTVDFLKMFHCLSDVTCPLSPALCVCVRVCARILNV